jgi:hypothetical protein
MEYRYQISGFFRQIYILLWKNAKLTLRNRSGTFIELFCPLLFLAVLLVVRNYVDKYNYEDQISYLNDTIDLLPIFIRRTRVLYYPNNIYIKNLIENAVGYIQLRQPFFNPRSNYMQYKIYLLNEIQKRYILFFCSIVIGVDSSDCKSLDSIMQLRLIALVTFPDNYSQGIPNNAEYSICTQE